MTVSSWRLELGGWICRDNESIMLAWAWPLAKRSFKLSALFRPMMDVGVLYFDYIDSKTAAACSDP